MTPPTELKAKACQLNSLSHDLHQQRKSLPKELKHSIPLIKVFVVLRIVFTVYCVSQHGIRQLRESTTYNPYLMEIAHTTFTVLNIDNTWIARCRGELCPRQQCGETCTCKGPPHAKSLSAKAHSDRN